MVYALVKITCGKAEDTVGGMAVRGRKGCIVPGSAREPGRTLDNNGASHPPIRIDPRFLAARSVGC